MYVHYFNFKWFILKAPGFTLFHLLYLFLIVLTKITLKQANYCFLVQLRESLSSKHYIDIFCSKKIHFLSTTMQWYSPLSTFLDILKLFNTAEVLLLKSLVFLD